MDEEKKPSSVPSDDGKPAEEAAAPEPPADESPDADATSEAGSSDQESAPGKEPEGETTAKKAAKGEAAKGKAAEDAEPSPKKEASADADSDPEKGDNGKSEPAGKEKPAAKPGAAKKAAGDRPKKRPRPARKKGPVYEDLEEDELLKALGESLGEDVVSAQSFLQQNIYTVDRKRLLDAMLLLKDDHGFDYLVDLTALDYLGDEARWCLVYHLLSHESRQLIRVKSRLEEGDVAPSVSAVWRGADWMEREVYDMFGIEFAGHPDLRRILLPEDWHGYPLRKDYDIKLQDQSWINRHLRIRKVPN